MSIRYSLRLAQTELEQREALHLLESDPAAQSLAQELTHLLESDGTNQLDDWNLLIALESHETQATPAISGVILVYCQPDDSATIFPPRCDHACPDSSELENLLLQGALRLARERSCEYIQSLLCCNELAISKLFTRHGIPKIGDLIFMQSPRNSVNRPAARSTADNDASEAMKLSAGIPIRLLSIGEEHGSPALEQLIEGTYRDSADFPELVGRKTGRDALRTHRLQGDFDPRFWYWIQHGGDTAGVVLLAHHPRMNQMEITYLGILPEFRRHGLARYAIDSVLSNEDFADRPFFLGVDARNLPAIKLYDSCGFVPWGRQWVHFCWLAEEAS